MISTLLGDDQEYGDEVVKFKIVGEPASKANSREFRWSRKQGRMISAKSDKALVYVDGFIKQCPRLPALIEGDVWVVIKVWYASFRPDLDESVILDAMQGYIYKNDRQVARRLAMHMGVDQRDPRAEIHVGRMRVDRRSLSQGSPLSR